MKKGHSAVTEGVKTAIFYAWVEILTLLCCHCYCNCSFNYAKVLHISYTYFIFVIYLIYSVCMPDCVKVISNIIYY